MPVVHHGPVLNRKRTAVSAWFSRGRVNHSLGYDPLFQLAMGAHRATDRPYVVGGLLMIAGYVSSVTQRQPRVLPSERSPTCAGSNGCDSAGSSSVDERLALGPDS